MLMKTTRFLACWGGFRLHCHRGRRLFCCSKGGREFLCCNRRLAGTILFDSSEVALANELSPEVELLLLDGVAFFEI